MGDSIAARAQSRRGGIAGRLQLWRLRRGMKRWRRKRDKQKFPWHTRLRRSFFVGTQERRHVYARFMRVLRPVASGRRRRAARALAGDRRWRIDRAAGFAVLPAGTLPEADAVVAEVARMRAAGRLDGLPYDRKPHLQTGLVDAATLDLEGPLLRLALAPPVLAAVSDYLGSVPTLAMVDVWQSRDREDARASSRSWHCDWEAEHCVKLFVYCSDVDEEHGPLALVPAARSRQLRRALGYVFGGKAARVSDAEMGPLLEEGDLQTLTGPAGTVVLVDTNACFHFGSRIRRPGLTRTVAVLTYFPVDSFDAERGEYETVSLAHLARPDLPPAARLALGAAR